METDTNNQFFLFTPAVTTLAGFDLITVVRNGDSGYLYVNGIYKDSKTVDGANTLTVRYISSPSTSCFFNGTIDEVRISNVARSANWIGATNKTLTDALLGWGTLEELSPYMPSASVMSKLIAAGLL